MSTYAKQRHGFIGEVKKEIKRLSEMAELKWLWTCLNIAGYTNAVWILFISIFDVDIITRSVMSVLAVIFISAKIFVYISSSIMKHKITNLEKRERELAIREREISAYEKETAIIKSFNKMII